MQRLILPINKCKLTASYKTAAYRRKYGFAHYGCDLIWGPLIKDRRVWASGNGIVVAKGWDNACGNVLAVKYYSARNRATGQVCDVVMRYMHLQSFGKGIVMGATVNKDTLLGEYGGTGKYGGGVFNKHLHIEADVDVKNPLWTPTVTSSNLLVGSYRGANDKTMSNPLDWLHCKTSAPDRQSFTGDVNLFVRATDRYVPATT